MRDEAESAQTVVVTFTVVYKTDAPADYDPDRALDKLLDIAPCSFALTGRDELMDDAYDMEAVGWEIHAEPWGDIGTGEPLATAAAPSEPRMDRDDIDHALTVAEGACALIVDDETTEEYFAGDCESAIALLRQLRNQLLAAAPSEPSHDSLKDAVIEAAREWDSVWKPPVAAAGQAMADWKLHESLAAYDRALSTTPEEPRDENG